MSTQTIDKQTANVLLAAWLSENAPDVFQALAKAAGDHASQPLSGIGGITDILKSIGSGITSAAKSVASGRLCRLGAHAANYMRKTISGLPLMTSPVLTKRLKNYTKLRNFCKNKVLIPVVENPFPMRTFPQAFLPTF